MTIDDSHVVPMLVEPTTQGLVVDDSEVVPMVVPEIHGPAPKLTRQGVRDLGNSRRPNKDRSYFDQLCRRGVHQTAGQHFQDVTSYDPRRYGGIMVKLCGHCGAEVDTFDPREDEF